MMRSINKFCLAVLCFACVGAGPRSQPPPGSTWVLYSFGKNGTYVASATDMGFAFPEWSRHAAFPAFLTTTVDASVLGNLTGDTISATVTITASADAIFVFGGQIPGWNVGSFPASGRLWFSASDQPYTVSDGINNEDRYWWSLAGAFVTTNNLGTVTVSDTLAPSHWVSANGHHGDDPSFADRFSAAIAAVRQIGVSFGGGDAFDVGVGLSPGTGPASFRLESFTVHQP